MLFLFTYLEEEEEEEEEEERMIFFNDLEAAFRSPVANHFSGRRRQQKRPAGRNASQEVASGIFKINIAVNSFFRLVNLIGTPKDTLQLREKLQKARLEVIGLVKSTLTKLKEASDEDFQAASSANKKIADAKLAKDFQYVLEEFKKAQRLAVQRETVYAPSP